MAASKSYVETKKLIEEALGIPIKIGLKTNIDKWIGLDPKITMEDIYIKKYIERMNILEIPIKALDNFFKQFSIDFSKEKTLKQIMPDLSTLRINEESIEMAVKNHLIKQAKQYTEIIEKSIKEWEETFRAYFLKDEEHLNETLTNLFYRTKIVSDSFEIKRIRIVEENLYLYYEKTTPCINNNFRITSKEELENVVNLYTQKLEEHLEEMRIKEVNFSEQLQTILKDKQFLMELEKIADIKIWANEISTFQTTDLEQLLASKEQIERIRSENEEFLLEMLYTPSEKPLKLKNGNFLMTKRQAAKYELNQAIKFVIKRRIKSTICGILVGIENRVFKINELYELNLELKREEQKNKESLKSCKFFTEEQITQLLIKFKETEEYWNGRSNGS